LVPLRQSLLEAPGLHCRANADAVGMDILDLFREWCGGSQKT
jgi:hypothetical protein